MKPSLAATFQPTQSETPHLRVFTVSTEPILTDTHLENMQGFWGDGFLPLSPSFPDKRGLWSARPLPASNQMPQCVKMWVCGSVFAAFGVCVGSFHVNRDASHPKSSGGKGPAPPQHEYANTSVWCDRDLRGRAASYSALILGLLLSEPARLQNLSHWSNIKNEKINIKFVLAVGENDFLLSQIQNKEQHNLRRVINVRFPADISDTQPRTRRCCCSCKLCCISLCCDDSRFQ